MTHIEVTGFGYLFTYQAVHNIKRKKAENNPPLICFNTLDNYSSILNS